ncbi:AAA family ATPase, partial [Pseudomonas aeruginosa]
EKQAMRFIPVIKAAGGSEGEALDHLLSTRVMRKGKVTGRYDVSLDALKTLQDALLTFWEEAGLDGVPQSCNQLLEADIRRLEGVN